MLFTFEEVQFIVLRCCTIFIQYLMRKSIKTRIVIDVHKRVRFLRRELHDLNADALKEEKGDGEQSIRLLRKFIQLEAQLFKNNI